jgi:uncharacterized membrane protein YesL
VLRACEFVAYPALAGAAFVVLCLGVVTWLPALAALAESLRRWRSDGETACFVTVFAAFPRMWRTLWRHGVVSTVVCLVLAVNAVFLAGQGSIGAVALLGAQLGIGVALVPYHLALAAVAATNPDAGPADLRRRALLVAFGRPARGLGLLAAALLAPVVTIVIPLGPLLLGSSLPVLYALTQVKEHR